MAGSIAASREPIQRAQATRLVFTRIVSVDALHGCEDSQERGVDQDEEPKLGTTPATAELVFSDLNHYGERTGSPPDGDCCRHAWTHASTPCRVGSGPHRGCYWPDEVIRVV